MMAKIFYFLLLLAPLTYAIAQDATSVDRQEVEERYRRFSADIEGLLAANASLQKRISGIADELRKLRDDHERLEKSSSVQDDLKRLSEKIAEVDRKREADRELILKEIEKLGKLLAAEPAPRNQVDPAPRNTADEVKIPDKGYEYTIQSGDSLVAVLGAFNAKFREKGLKPVSLKQLLLANPGLKHDSKLKVGQKIFVPVPDPR